ncbi:hypothetical protein NK8_71100 (plasmid) [Caballeronia sp. NK8]|nr:hypothetical protein NK8_71100 [Caballeronia sp. NK8]
MLLGHYRQHLGLSALPSPNEDTPLVLAIGATASKERTKTAAPLTRAGLHAIVKDVFAGAAARLRELDDPASTRADLLEKDPAHWLSHSAGSHMADHKADLHTRATTSDMPR